MTWQENSGPNIHEAQEIDATWHRVLPDAACLGFAGPNVTVPVADLSALLDEVEQMRAAVSAVLDKKLTPHPRFAEKAGRGGAKEVDLFYGKNIGFNEAANLLRYHLGKPALPVPTPDEVTYQ